MTLFPEYYVRSTLSVSDRSPERERERGWMGGGGLSRVFLMRFGLGNYHYTFNLDFDFFSCQLLASSLPDWASGVSCFRWGCWCMGRGPMVRETCLGFRYITVSCTKSENCVFWTCSRMKRIILFSLISYVCNAVSVICIWDVFPYEENHSVFFSKLSV